MVLRLPHPSLESVAVAAFVALTTASLLAYIHVAAPAPAKPVPRPVPACLPLGSL